jgi:3-methyladenine DNA glycosylase/8-oxoguanine DNA glycosylase
MRQPSWVPKAQIMLELASKWASLSARPVRRSGARDAADKAFEASAKSVRGVGLWTVNEFMIGLGRTDVLQTGCHEVKTGLKHLLEAEGKPPTVAAWSKASRFRPDHLTRVSNILRRLHRSVQASRSAKASACTDAQAALAAIPRDP